MQNLDTLLVGLRAAGEHTRLRIYALCLQGELSVSELVDILGQSQPRVSRHLKLMVNAGLLERLPEGKQVFYRVSDHAVAAPLTRALSALMPDDDPTLLRDLDHLRQVRDARARKAQDYFATVADSWDSIRSLYVPQQQVEEKLVSLVNRAPVDQLLDIGTGTGRVLELLAAHVDRGTGVDLNSDMLTVARSNIEQGNLTNVHVRKGDMYRLPIDSSSVDLAVLHMVLHYSDDPASVIREAARVLKSGGRLMIVDFAVHGEEHLREKHQHHRLGFADAEIAQCCEAAGLSADLQTDQLIGDPLTVKFWIAQANPAS